jgi:purine-binding chemotaxis protein CheW
MENGQRPFGGLAGKLQEALRAFGPGSGTPANTADIAALAQRMGLSTAPQPTPTPGEAQRTPQATSGSQFVFIMIGKLELGLLASNVSGVERIAEITPVPNTADWVVGVANLRGSITSVIDLHGFLDLQREAITTRSRIVVASSGGMVMGILVDSVTEIRALPDENIIQEGAHHFAPAWLAPFITGMTQSSGRRVLLVDLARLLFTDSLHHYRNE